jgi:hypothetical protein
VIKKQLSLGREDLDIYPADLKQIMFRGHRATESFGQGNNALLVKAVRNRGRRRKTCEGLSDRCKSFTYGAWMTQMQLLFM